MRIGTLFADLCTSVMRYMEQLMFNLHIKAFIAIACTIFTDILFGNVIVLYVYLGFAMVDMVFGMLRAAVHGTFQARYILKWLVKVSAYCFVSILFGLASYAMFAVTTLVIPIVNAMLLCCILTELGSIIDNMHKAGCPIHPMIYAIMKVLRKQAAKNISKYIGDDPDVQKEIEEALKNVSEDVSDA